LGREVCMSRGWTRRMALLRLAPAAVGLALALAVPAASLAAPPLAPESGSSSIRLALVLVADHPRGSAALDTTVSGACGSASLTITPTIWPGVAAIALRVTSSWGPMLSAGWSIRWQNASSATANAFAGSQLVLGDVLARTAVIWTGRGMVTAWLESLDVLLWWGVHCRGLGPWDQAWIA
ncbi:MAG: hypothetical protein ACXVAE_04490, partial [Candidatus Limnocylindrales bacterium]